ncbi:hypothetical protein FACS1894160_1540 [Bacteroidia bacterium]|nr:hypothetical protein FACS1894160_1540 [Bacteroidia bacterium]
MRKISVLILLFCACLSVAARDKINIVIQAGDYDREDCVVSAEVSPLNFNGSEIILYETAKGKKQKVVSQLASGKKPVLYWILTGKTPAGSSRTFVAEWSKKKQSSAKYQMEIEDTQKALVLKKNGKPVLQYNYAHLDPPQGVDKSFGRSGFIHPAYSPDGNILTTIQPKDHRHHFGIWNPWTHLVYDGILYDLWNIGDKQGTVRAKDIEAIYQGNIFAGYVAGLDHFIFTPAGEKIVMNEQWDIKTWNTGEGFLWNFTSYLHPSTPLPVLLQQYRYAGFGYRATEEWTKENSEMFTSEGKTRQQIDGSTARWIYVTGQTKTGRSGLLFLGHPENYNSPEPLRIWDEAANDGRGDVFINFAPTKNKDWELKPGNTYALRYQVLSYEGEMTSERANRIWNDFAYPPSVAIKTY